MKIESVYIKNFKSIGNNGYTFNFNDKFQLIRGKPGKGKTTILSAITFCLFNENTDYKGNSKSTLPSNKLINDINKKEMLVEVKLSNGYTIRRGLAPAVFQVLNEKGIDINELSSKKLDQTELEQKVLNGLTFDLFMTTNYLTNKPSSIPFLYMSKTQRKDYIEKLLDLRIVYFMNENLKPFISENTMEKTMLEKEINLTNSTIENETFNIKNQMIKLEEQKKKLANYEEDKVKRIHEQEELIQNNKNELIRLNDKLNLHKEDIHNLKDRLVKFDKEKYSNLINEKNIKVEKLNSLTNAIKQKQMEKDVFEKNKSNYGNCGDCEKLQFVIGAFDYDKYKEIQLKSAEFYKGVQVEIENLNKEIEFQESLKKEEDRISIQINDILSQVQDLEYSIDSCNIRIKNSEILINNINNESKPELFEINIDYLKSLKEKVLELENKLNENYNNKVSLDELKKSINDKEHKAKALKTYLPLFENKLNELLDRFLVNQEFTIKAKLEDDFELSFTKNQKEVDIFSLSNGQKGLISLSVTFAFLYLLEVKHQNSFNHLFVDEILDSGLNQEVLWVLDYLKELSIEKNITVISHNNFLLDYPEFDKTIEAQIENGFSKYIEI